MTPEQRAKKNFKDASVGKLNIQSIENRRGEAMPDWIVINRKGTVFWIEAKALGSWPVRASTAPLKSAFERGQIGWGREWQSWRGRSFILLRVDKEFFLFNTASISKEMTKTELMEVCLISGRDSIIDRLSELE